MLNEICKKEENSKPGQHYKRTVEMKDSLVYMDEIVFLSECKNVRCGYTYE